MKSFYKNLTERKPAKKNSGDSRSEKVIVFNLRSLEKRGRIQYEL